MVQRGNRARLALEADPIVDARERAGENLQRDRAIEPGVAGAIDLAHAAVADGRGDLIRAELRAWRQPHDEN